MVKIENIVESKETEVKQLAKEVFGKPINVSVRESHGDIYVIKNAFRWYFFCRLTPLLVISPFNNEIRLYHEKYFDKAKEFANKYETNFGGKVTLKTDYSKR
jgi:hypothetical protein